MDVFQFFLDKPNNVYLPGELLSGRVLIRCSKPIKARNMCIEIKGCSKVEWSEQKTRTDSQGKSHTYTKRYHSHVRVLEGHMTVWERQEKDQKFPDGEHWFNFSFQLPYALPPTFSSYYGCVKYELEARVDVPWWFDKTTCFPFQIASFYDLNLAYNGGNKQVVQIAKKYGFFHKENVNIRVELDKSAYAIGEGIQCTVDIDAPSGRHIKKVEFSLVQIVECRAEGSYKQEFKTIASVLTNFPKHDKTTMLREQKPLAVMPTIPSFKTPNISVTYELKTHLRINGKLWDNHPDICMPVEIGTVPVRTMY